MGQETLAAPEAVKRKAECAPESEATSKRSGGRFSQSKDLVPGGWCKSDRLRVLDFRLPPGDSVTVTHTVPTVRWQVSEFDEEATREPLFFESGAEHSITNESKDEHREIVFEILTPPQLNDEEVEALTRKAEYQTLVGTELKLENRYCRVSDLNLPPNGGNPSNFHQHALPYGMVWIGETHMLVWEPAGDGDKQAKQIGDVHIKDGHFTWKQVERGGMDEDDHPHFGWAVHNITNASSKSWLRVLHIELK